MLPESGHDLDITKLHVRRQFNRRVLQISTRRAGRRYDLWNGVWKERARLRAEVLWRAGRVVGIVLQPLPGESGDSSESEWNSDVQEAIANQD